MISSADTCEAFRGKKYGNGGVSFLWDDSEPTTIRIACHSQELGIKLDTRVLREDLALALSGQMVKTLRYGMHTSGTRLWIGWKDDDGTPSAAVISAELALFVLNESESIVGTGSDEEQAIVDAACEDLAERMRGWTL